MKKIIIILLAIIVSSCVTELKMYSTQYSINNQTGTEIKLKFYLTTTDELVDIYTINTNSILQGEIIERGSTSPLDYPDDSLARNGFSVGDSIIVVFNNQKQKIMQTNINGFSEPINRNIYRHGNYDYIGNDKFQFTFTEEDYENAEDCGGNCD